MYKVIIGGKIHNDGIKLLQSVENFDVTVLPDASTETLEDNLSDADAILLRLQPFNRSMIEKSKNLKILSRNGVGYDAIDINSLNKRKIPLTIVGDVNSSSVAEHTIMFMLSLLKQIKFHDNIIRSNQWSKRDQLLSSDIEGKKIFIIGFGKIGQKVAKILDAMAGKVIVYDPYVNKDQLVRTNYDLVDNIDNGIADADIITIHAPSSGSNYLIDKHQFSLMKKNVVLINTSRGSHINIDELATALEKGIILGAGLDVFPTEPPAIEHRLFKLDNILFSPHIAGLTNECASRMSLGSAQNIIDALNGKLNTNLLVNKDILENY